MDFYIGCSDGTFEMGENWIIECIMCDAQHRVDRNSLNISVAERGNTVEYYFWGRCPCRKCGAELFYRTKVYERSKGVLAGKDHECDDVEFMKPPVIHEVR